jgi:hypothetical protein
MAATTAAIAGIAATAATTGQSFSQMRKQRRLQDKAQEEAAKMLAEARKKLDMNYYRELAIQKEPYELEREAMIAAGAQGISAAAESERSVAGAAGRIQMAQQAGQRDIAAAMGQEMLNLDKLVAQEQSRLRDIGAQIDLTEAEGAQLAAAQAAEAAGRAQTQAFEGVVNLGTQALNMVPQFTQKRGIEQQAFGALEGGMNIGGQDMTFKGISEMDPRTYRRFIKGLTKQQRAELFSSPGFQKAFAPLYQQADPFNIYNNTNTPE